MDNLEIIKKLFKVINIEIKTSSDLNLVEIDRELMLKDIINNEFSKLIDSCKNIYKTSKLTALHGNRLSKQKFPAINLLRQILKCHKYKMTPKITSLGYHKNGKKIIKHSYIINEIINDPGTVNELTNKII